MSIREGKESRKKTHTVVIIVTNHHLLDLAKLAHLAPEVLVEGVEVVLQLRRVHLDLGVVGRVLVQVGQQDGLRVRGLDVLARAAVAVAARADLVVEGAVDLVGLGAEDRGEVVGHLLLCVVFFGVVVASKGCSRWTMVEARKLDGAFASCYWSWWVRRLDLDCLRGFAIKRSSCWA